MQYMKNFGTTVADNLIFNEHAAKVHMKVSSSLFLLMKLKHAGYVLERIKKFSQSLIIPHCLYR